MSKRIFVVDDEPNMTMLSERLLTLKGFNVNHANDPMKGLEQLSGEDYDLIFVDLMMPEMSGFDFVAKLRASDRHKNTPIIVLSAKRLSDEERKRLLLDRARFLMKPLSPRQLFEVVQDCLGDARPEPSSKPN